MVTQGQRLNFLLSALLLLLAACSSQSPQQAQRAVEQRQFLERQLAELDALAAPEGVRPDTWAELKAGLAAAIESRLADGSAKAASAAPTSAGARMPLLFDLDANTFTWQYFNPGDYDQNGEVNISDLTPLAVHLNEAVPAGPNGADSIQAVIDGDGNGQVNISDLTPLGANLGKRITQFNLYASGDPAALPPSNSSPSVIPSTASVLFSAAQGQSNLERIHFRFVSSPLLDEHIYWLRPADGAAGLEGTPSSLVMTENGNYQTPALLATPFTGSAPLTTVLEVANPTFGTEYRFDPEGDLTYISTGQVTSFGYTYQEAGTYDAQVQVVTSLGLVLSASVVVNVDSPPNWYRYSLPASDYQDIPMGLALEEQDGRPHLFVTSGREGESAHDLAYLAAHGPTGSTWGTWRHIMGTGPLGRLASTQLNGRVGLAYAGSDFLFFKRSITPQDPSSGWEQQIAVDTGGDPYEWYSLKFVDGRASIAFHEAASDNFYYLRATGTLGDGWLPVETPVAGTSQGRGVSLAEIGGRPAIAYYDRGGFGALEYTRAQNAEGTAWNAPTQITLGNFTMFDTLLVLADGAPGIVTHNYTDSELRFYRAASAAGNWNGSVVLDQTDGSQQTIPRAVMVGNIPHAFWYNAANGRLFHAAALDPEALEWTEPELISTGLDPTVLPAPGEINGMPAVAYALESGGFGYAIYY